MGAISETYKLTIQFGVLQDNPATIEKTFVNSHSENCYPFNELNVLNPTFILKYENVGQISTKDFYSNYNYFYIPEWNRYYFMEPPVYDSGLVYITGQEDVLMTFKDELLNPNFKVILARTEEKEYANAYLGDDAARPYVAAWTSTINFSDTLDEGWLLNDEVMVLAL